MYRFIGLIALLASFHVGSVHAQFAPSPTAPAPAPAAPSAPAPASSLPGPGLWKNQRGSELSVAAVGPDGNFTGTYTNRAAGFACKDEPFDVAGRFVGKRVSFHVVWKNDAKKLNCNSITAWRGAVRGDRMRTVWRLAFVDARGGVLRIVRGRDSFKK